VRRTVEIVDELRSIGRALAVRCDPPELGSAIHRIANEIDSRVSSDGLAVELPSDTTRICPICRQLLTPSFLFVKRNESSSADMRPHFPEVQLLTCLHCHILLSPTT
jgi:hypothetical protein